MRTLLALGSVAGMLAAGESGATPTLNLLPSTTSAAPGQAGIALTIQRVDDVSAPLVPFTLTFGVVRSSGDAVITAAARPLVAARPWKDADERRAVRWRPGQESNLRPAA